MSATNGMEIGTVAHTAHNAYWYGMTGACPDYHESPMRDRWEAIARIAAQRIIHPESEQFREGIVIKVPELTTLFYETYYVTPYMVETVDKREMIAWEGCVRHLVNMITADLGSVDPANEEKKWGELVERKFLTGSFSYTAPVNGNGRIEAMQKYTPKPGPVREDPREAPREEVKRFAGATFNCTMTAVFGDQEITMSVDDAFSLFVDLYRGLQSVPGGGERLLAMFGGHDDSDVGETEIEAG